MKYPSPYLSEIEKNVINYLRTHPESKSTCSQMVKPGNIKKPGISYNWLKKKLEQLEEKGVIYGRKIKDPVRNIEYVYYSLIYGCDEKGSYAIPSRMIKNENTYRNFLKEYYESYSSNYFPLHANFCKLCDLWGKNLKMKDCGFFIELFQAIEKDDFRNIKEIYDLKDKDIKSLKEDGKSIFEKWAEDDTVSLSFFLEDLTIILIGYLVFHSPSIVKCEDCKLKKRCTENGLKWIRRFLNIFVENNPSTELKDFWDNILSGNPKIRTDLLYKYFSSRFPLSKNHNCFVFLKHFEDMNGLPYIYSKAIPLTIILLIENIIIPSVSELIKICEKYEKRIK